ncbi:MAG: RHS repeat protein [Bacteroidales bacterium]|nr:RHS repeat protein [Bacteroidales bacterium]
MKKTNFYFMLFIAFSIIGFTGCDFINNGDKSENDESSIALLKQRPESPVIMKITKYKTDPLDTLGAILKAEIFNEKGLRIEFIGYDFYGSGKETDRTKYEYDENGNLITINEDPDEAGTTETKTYDKEGRVKTYTWSRPNGQGASEERFYNEKGDEIEIKYYDVNKKYDFSRVYEYIYDEKGNTISEKKWEKYSDGTADFLSYHVTMKFDENGNEIEKNYFREDGFVYTKKVLKYDAFGNMVEMIEYEKDEVAYRDVNLYNEYGELVKAMVYSGMDLLNYTNTYKYDKYGHKIYMMYVHEDGDAWGERTVYEFY